MNTGLWNLKKNIAHNLHTNNRDLRNKTFKLWVKHKPKSFENIFESAVVRSHGRQQILSIFIWLFDYFIFNLFVFINSFGIFFYEIQLCFTHSSSLCEIKKYDIVRLLSTTKNTMYAAEVLAKTTIREVIVKSKISLMASQRRDLGHHLMRRRVHLFQLVLVVHLKWKLLRIVINCSIVRIIHPALCSCAWFIWESIVE